MDQKWKLVDIYKHRNQANVKKGFTRYVLSFFLPKRFRRTRDPCRIIMNFVDNDDVEGFGEHAYTMSDKSVLFDGDGDHILSSAILSSRRKPKKQETNKKKKKKEQENVTLVENTKKRKKSNSDANIQHKKKKKAKKKRKKLPPLLKSFKSALKNDATMICQLEIVADKLQGQLNNLREKIKKYRDKRADTFLEIFEGVEERLADMNERLDDVEDED